MEKSTVKTASVTVLSAVPTIRTNSSLKFLNGKFSATNTVNRLSTTTRLTICDLLTFIEFFPFFLSTEEALDLINGRNRPIAYTDKKC